ncbi:MAG: SMP-30/gluconolactonase/LRE family protein [Coraliomargaritaceae bacterium]
MNQSSLKIQAIGKRHSLWGEGPIWWNDSLYYVDIEGKAIIRINPDTEEETVWEFPERIGCIAPCNNSQLLYAGDNGISIFDIQTKVSTSITDPENHLPDNRFNDGKCDPYGRFWGGTISLKKIKGSASLYCLDTNQNLEKKLEGLTNSNGLAWSQDKKRFFHIDTPSRSIQAYIYNGASAEISQATTIVDTEALGFDSSPDGMTIDVQDNLWVAFCHGGCVACFDSRNGKLLQTIEIPAIETTACTFGGTELKRLFVTTGIKKDTPENNAGRIFVIDGLPIKGTPPNTYTLV